MSRQHIVSGARRKYLPPVDKLRNDEHNLADLTPSGQVRHSMEPAGIIQRWDAILSSAEKQQLAIARVIYQRPSMVVLDNAPASLAEEVLEDIYRELCRNKISAITICQLSPRRYPRRQTVQLAARRFHSVELCLDRSGLGDLKERDER